MCLKYSHVTTSIYLAIAVISMRLAVCRCQTIEPASNHKVSEPKDYSYSAAGLRVQDMVEFFESMKNDNFYNPENKKKKESIISLSEAASKLHSLSSGQNLESKCNKYVKLIEKPNIRTFASVKDLMEELKVSSEIAQNDANLVSRLMNERKFDALGKIQTLIQSIESERENLRSTYTASVKKELLNCINYYIYRHQRSTYGLVEYVRDNLYESELYSEQYSASDNLIRKLTEIKEKLLLIELDLKTRSSNWLEELSKLYQLIKDNNFEIPVDIQQFVAEPQRIKRLESYKQILTKAQDLKTQILDLENNEPLSSLRTNENYQESILELCNLNKSYRNLLPIDIADFIDESNRLKVIEGINAIEIGSLRFRSDASGSEMINTLSVSKKESLDNHQQELIHEAENEDDHITLHPNRNYCRELLNNFSHTLRKIDIRIIDIEQIKNISESINRFNSDCHQLNINEFTAGLSHWPMLSLARKLYMWSSNKLQDSELSQSEKSTLRSASEILIGIQRKEFDRTL